MTSEIKRVAIYARVSSEKQDVDLSISAQLKALREYAARNGYQVVREFVDEAESGRSIDRPAFKQMIGVAKQRHPPFEAILVWKLSRFARSREDSIVFKALLRKHGVQVVSITEPLTDTPTGKLLEAIIESLDEFYSANLGQEVLRGMRESASRGFYVAAYAPFGYQRVKVRDGNKERPKLQVHPHQAPLVARIFREFLAGAGLKDLARSLNNDGILTPRGKRWGKTTVHKILTNEAYTGTLVWGRTSKNSGKTEPIRVEGAWEPIVDRETFARVQSLLEQRAPVHQHPRRVNSHYLLSGLARCGHCGKAMVCQEAKSGQFSYYICSTLLKQGAGTCPAPYLNSQKFEKVVIDKIKERILTEKNLSELVRLVNEEMDAQATETRQRLETITAEIADVNRRLERLYDALESGKFSLNDLSPRIQLLRHREDQLQAARLELEGLLSERRIQLADEKMVRSYVENLRDLLTNSSIAEQKAFIRSFVKEVRVTSKEVVLTYTIPLQPEGPLQETATVLDTVHSGERWGTRTPDTLIKSQVLYH